MLSNIGNILPHVKEDIFMMKQVLVNLLSNAVKYSSKRENPLVTIDYERTRRR
jgi:signal transduction histidine kinase